MTTKPATAPEQNPSTLAFPRKTYSSIAQVKDAIAVASVVVVNAFAAMPSAPSALPALKPYQPTQSIPAPTMHSMVLCMVGAGMLWVGWYGFNAGSALGADGIAANAFTTTTLATAIASFTWAMLEYVLRGKASVLGFCSGAVAGLVVITPACGYVDPTGAVLIGVAAGIVPFFACTKLKSWFHYDDALDTFGVHAVGGTLGAFLTGIFATANVNPNLSLSTAGSLNPATQKGLARIVAHMLW